VKISWTDRVSNQAVSDRENEERNILDTIRRGKAIWIGHILRRNCLLSHINEGKIMGTRRRGRRRKQLLDDLKEARRYWKLKQEAQVRTLWRTHVSLEEAMDLSQDRLLLDFDRNGCGSGNKLDSYSGGVRFESRPRHRLLCLRFSWFSRSLQGQIGRVCGLAQVCFIPKPSQFTIDLPTYYSSLYSLATGVVT
jgi:hypothetical protein